MNHKKFECIVIGGGHAGIEAALAASRMGCKTAMVILSADTIGHMSCNPAIGGIGKGQLVKEIDSLGGEMGLAADRTGIQFRQLNASKGKAVRSSRCQSDRKRYALYMQRVVLSQDNLEVIEGEAAEILVKGGRVSGLKLASGMTLTCHSVVLAAGTFLKGRIHIGKKIIPGGRIHEPASISLADNIRDLGLEILTFKTGTPPRLDGKTIDFSKCIAQYSDPTPVPFSFKTPQIPNEQKLLPCHITYTTEETHDIIKKNFHLSPMYSGQIDATGVRYCPSIEDKLKKFSDKGRHHVFLEPVGLDTDEYYPNGISTGLPEDVQDAFLHSIPGLEKARINQYGYSIEHGVIPPTSLTLTLETKKIKGLFLAGQVNGSTGYEEAAAQGIMAGINAALYVEKKEPFILGRDEAYIGVLIDDLTTKGTQEPYRMFTSRVEYRLIVREDNADKRLSGYGYKFRLLKKEEYETVLEKYRSIDAEIEHLRNVQVVPGDKINDILKENNSAPLKRPASLGDILRRPEITYDMISGFNGKLKYNCASIIEQVEYEIKYEGFIKRQKKEIERFRHIENIKIPASLDYTKIPGLSIEIQQKLSTFAPLTLGQANRISGVTPAAISILMVTLKKLSYQRNKKNI